MVLPSQEIPVPDSRGQESGLALRMSYHENMIGVRTIPGANGAASDARIVFLIKRILLQEMCFDLKLPVVVSMLGFVIGTVGREREQRH